MSGGSPPSASTSNSSPARFSVAMSRSCSRWPGDSCGWSSPRLGVDEVGGKRARVPPEERVRERAVAPEEPGEVQAGEQVRERVEQLVAQVGHAGAGAAEEHPVGERELEVARDQHAVQAVRAAAYPADHLDHGHRFLAEPAEQPVLAPGEALRELLQRVDAPVVLDEAHDVPADAAGHLDEALVLPLLERLRPRQVQEVGMARAGDELQADGHRGTQARRPRRARGPARGTSRATRGAGTAGRPTSPPTARTGRARAGGPATAPA